MNTTIEDVLKAEAIGFAEYIKSERWAYYNNGKWKKLKRGHLKYDDEYITTEQLYNLYKQ